MTKWSENIGTEYFPMDFEIQEILGYLGQSNEPVGWKTNGRGMVNDEQAEPKPISYIQKLCYEEIALTLWNVEEQSVKIAVI